MAGQPKTAEKTINAEVLPPDELSLAQLNAMGIPEDEPVPDDIAFTNLLADIGANDDGGRVNVYKLEKGNYRDRIFLFDCAPSEFDITMLQNPEYHEDGFHDFNIVARNRTGIVKAKVLKVMPKKDFKRDSAQAFNPELIVAPITTALSAMQENTNRLIAAIAANQAPAKSTSDVLQEMLLMKQILGGDAKPAPNPMEMMRTVVELSREIAQPEGGSTSSDVMIKLMEKFGGPILEAVQAGAQAPQPAMIPAPVRVNPAPRQPVLYPPVPVESQISEAAKETTVAEQNAEPLQTQETEDMSIKLKMGLSFLVAQARDDADPSLYAALAVDQIGPQNLAEYVNLPNWLDMLAGFNPEVKNHEAWFTEWHGEIKNQLTEHGITFTTDENLGKGLPDVPDNPDNGNPASNP